MTEALYLKDCYLKEFDATVVSVKDGKYIVLDKTAFYPVGGGEPHDTGKILFNGEEYNVVFTGKFDGEISHEVDKEGLKAGDKVQGIIDWDRRYRLMRMHTSAHVLASIIHKETGALITGGNLGLEKSSDDFSLENFDREKLQSYIDKANEVVKEGKDVRINFMSKEEAKKLSKLAEGNYEDYDELRLIEVDGVDIQPCGGCHLKNTSEIKGIKLVSLDNKGKGRKRIYFTLVD